MNPKIRVGMVGCGLIGRHHMGLFLAMPEAEIVAMTDPNAAQVEKCRNQFEELTNVPVFADHRQMLQETPMDAVCICTPHAFHFEQMNDALDAGLHVLIEKPMVCSSAEAMEIIKRFDMDPNKVGVLSYQRHYQGQFRFIREAIAKGEIGQVQFISGLLCQNWLELTLGTWRQDPAQSGGGQLNDSGSHLVDIILWATGLAATEVCAQVRTLGSPVDINSAVTISFANGAIGNLSIIGNAPEWNEELTIVGERGALYYRNGTLEMTTKSGGRAEITDLQPNSTPDHNFIQAILGAETVQSPINGALPVIQLTEAIWQSAASEGKSVAVNPVSSRNTGAL